MLYIDNQAFIRLVDNSILHKKTKHIDVRAYFIREKVQSRDVKVDYVSTTSQQAKFLTKPVTHIRFTFNREEIGIKPLPNSCTST